MRPRSRTDELRGLGSFFFSSRRRHTRFDCDWSSDVCSSDLTGATREELSGNSNVLAGRAAMLLVQQLYRKIFKKGEPAQSNTVFNRLDVDVGTVDPRTGQQQVSARFKVNDQFVIVGDIGVGGDYRGIVKYLIRFR